MPPSRAARPRSVYQVKITLKGTSPPIWRRLLVWSDTRLSVLHDVIQVAMGWYDSHLHQFVVGRVYYGVPDPDSWTEVKDESKVTFSQVAPGEKARITYEYDFGDSWTHSILVEKILPPSPNVDPPVCLAGRRACPPEDVGGVWGYADFLEAIADPEHEEHDEMLEWIGGEFDPAAFNMEAVNAQLRDLR